MSRESIYIIPGVPDGVFDKCSTKRLGHKNAVGNKEFVPPELFPAMVAVVTVVAVVTERSIERFKKKYLSVTCRVDRKSD